MELVNCHHNKKVHRWVLECAAKCSLRIYSTFESKWVWWRFGHILCYAERCGNPASPGAVQLGFHLAFCYAQNEPLCALLHRPRSKGRAEHAAPQRSRCLEISNQGNKWSTPEMLFSSNRETSVLFHRPHIIIFSSLNCSFWSQLVT